MPGNVLECAGSHFRMIKVEQKISKISTFSYVWQRFGSCLCFVVVVQQFLFQCHTRVIEQDTCKKKEKALRVPRAVNIGWRFTARMQMVIASVWCGRIWKSIPWWKVTWRPRFCFTLEKSRFWWKVDFSWKCLECVREASTMRRKYLKVFYSF